MTDVVEHPEEFDEGEFAWCRFFLCERVEVEFVDGEEPGMGKTRVSPDGRERGHLTDPDEQWHWRADADSRGTRTGGGMGGIGQPQRCADGIAGSGIGARTRTVEGLGRTATRGARCAVPEDAGCGPYPVRASVPSISEILQRTSAKGTIPLPAAGPLEW